MVGPSGTERRLDAFARWLASREQSRRQALKGAAKVLGGAAASSPLLARTEAALAATPKRKRCKPGHAPCGSGCCAPHQVCLTPHRKRGARRKPKPHCVCPSPRKQCAAGCVEVRSDPDNCGVCGHRCPAPTGGSARCAAGVCGASCSMAGETVCGGVCVNLQTSASNCGGCGHGCGSGMLCSQGQCVENCPSGETACGASCVNLQSDPAHCSQCGTRCPAPAGGTATCAAGVCGQHCTTTGDVVCSGVCVDTQLDADHCGGCGRSCSGNAGGAACIGGLCGCAQDSDCASGQYCGAGGVCVADETLGMTCTKGDQCASGHCVDGFCCNTACSGPCQACSAALQGGGQDGVCGNLPAGTVCGTGMSCNASGSCFSPLGGACTSGSQCASGACLPDDTNPSAKVCCASTCTNEGPCGVCAPYQGSCGTNGNCLHDGSGCAFYPVGTVCAPASCTNGYTTPAYTCTAPGPCMEALPQACANGLGCAGSACATTCTPGTGTGCASPSTTTCDSTGTGCLLNTGQSCTGGSQCLSGTCTSFVCT